MAQETDYKNIFQLSPAAFLLLDGDGVILDVNAKTCEWVNAKSEDVLGRNIFTLRTLPKESKVAILERFSDRDEGIVIEPYSIVFHLKSGSQLIGTVSETPIYDDKKKLNKVIVVISDITNLNISERSDDDKTSAPQIKSSEYASKDLIYRAIFDDSPVAIMIANKDEKIVSWNKFTEEMLKKTEKDLQLSSVKSLYPEEELDKMKLDIRKGAQHGRVETSMIRGDNSLVDVDLAISPFHDKEGNITGSIAIIRDITQLKEAEKVMLKAMKLKDNFMSMVSHELRTPLTAIKGSLGIIADGGVGDLGDDAKDFLNTAVRNVGRLEVLITNVLDYQRLETDSENFNLKRDNINTVIAMLRGSLAPNIQEKGLSFYVELSKNLPESMIDNEKITKMIEHLIDNAIRFTEKGSITIKTEERDGGVLVSISDTGVGIPEEDCLFLLDLVCQFLVRLLRSIMGKLMLIQK
ncbi:MAG: PAS domain S-box-containing protein [Candidatus Omnitrophota bacterium]|jgi:PAS domain S-box-containing protein